MKKTIAIIGGGPSALMLAANLDPNLFDVTLYERNVAVGRKFLVAGDGGFNLTHSEPIDNLKKRYTPPRYMEDCLSSFSNSDLQEWLRHIGIETYTGSSKRIFPVKGVKPIAVLNAILKVLKERNVQIKTKHLWMGWNENDELLFSNNELLFSVKPDVTVFALGGGSWSKTGSDGLWGPLFEKRHIQILPFQASNCAYGVGWPKGFIENSEGKPLKNISIACGDLGKKGEVVITGYGLEGGAIYALSPAIRKQLNNTGIAIVNMDLKPDYTFNYMHEILLKKGKETTTGILKKDLKLSNVQISLLRNMLSKEEFTDHHKLAQKIKKLPIEITGMAPVNEAISTVGGIALNETDAHFQLKKIPGTYVIGEMLDWDAPTGGYLLQACFSMGHYLARHLNS